MFVLALSADDEILKLPASTVVLLVICLSVCCSAVSLYYRHYGALDALSHQLKFSS